MSLASADGCWISSDYRPELQQAAATELCYTSSSLRLLFRGRCEITVLGKSISEGFKLHVCSQGKYFQTNQRPIPV